MSVPLIVLFGEASYAFYLVHQQVLTMLYASGWTREVSPATVAMQVFNLVIILALSLGLHLLVEKPARTWIKRSLERVPNAITVRRRAHPVVG